MRGKIAFVIGAAIGYVCGTRAGRERYEQIKRGAEALWNTEPVQKSVHLVRDAVDERAGDAISYVRRVSSEAFSNYAKRADDKNRAKRQQRKDNSTASAASQQSTSQQSDEKKQSSTTSPKRDEE